VHRSPRLPHSSVLCSGLTDPVAVRRPAGSGAVEQPPSAPQQRASITKNDAAGEPWGLAAGVIARSGCLSFPLTCRRRLMGKHRQEAGTAQRVRWGAAWTLYLPCSSQERGSCAAGCTGQQHACMIHTTAAHSRRRNRQRQQRRTLWQGVNQCPAACAFMLTCCTCRRSQHQQHWQQQDRCHRSAPLRAVQVRRAELWHIRR
jgi:hypothetical protein